MAKNTPAAVTVRAWAVEQGLLPAEGTKGARRGRIGTAVIDAYNAAHPKAKYPVTYRPKAGPSVKHTVTVEGANGRKRPVTRSLPLAQVRQEAQALGLAKGRGVLTKAAKDAVFLAHANAPKE